MNIRLLAQTTTISAALLGARLTAQSSAARDSALVRLFPGHQVRVTGGDSIWARESGAGKGALIGAVAGAVLAGVVLASLESLVCAGEACDVGGYFAKGALAGAAGGAVLGFTIGSAVIRWRLRFP